MVSNANTDVERLKSYGQMALEQGWYDQAREHFEQALALDASNREAMKGLARVNEILSRRMPTPVEPTRAESVEPEKPEDLAEENTEQEDVRIRWIAAHKEKNRRMVEGRAEKSAEWWRKKSADRLAEWIRREAEKTAEKKAERGREAARLLEERRRIIEEREKQYLARIERLDQLGAMSAREFEQFIASLFRRIGYAVEITTASADKGVDLFLERDGRNAIVQCKKYKGNVGQPTIRDFYGTMIHNKADQGYIVTTGTFSLPAQNWARGKQIHLVDGAELMDWIESLLTSTDEAATNTGGGFWQWQATQTPT